MSSVATHRGRKTVVWRGTARGSLLSVALSFPVVWGCQKPDKGAHQTPAPAPTVSWFGKAPPPAPTTPPYVPPPVKGHRSPVGPDLVILPGQGVGAVRFGTKLDKLAQLMGGECDFKTEARCVYIRAAAEFTLTDGAVSGMKFHRRDRQVGDAPEGKEKYYGSFNGGMRPKIMFGLLRDVVIAEYGKPERVEPLSGPDGQVERHFYPGLILEYDRLENQNVVLSGMEVLQQRAPGKAAATPEKAVP